MNLSISNQKKIFRQQIKDIKKTYANEELLAKSKNIFNLLNTLAEIGSANYILSYWSLDDEVNTHYWNNQQFIKGKHLLLPTIKNDELEIRYFEGEEKMVSTPPFGIKEPTGKVFKNISDIELIIVPGIAFDYKFHRLGRGKGFYDKFLKKVKALKIGICFDFQLFNEIPYDDNDELMDIIVSESNILRRK